VEETEDILKKFQQIEKSVHDFKKTRKENAKKLKKKLSLYLFRKLSQDNPCLRRSL
jgi:hypothetical protein